MFSTDSYEEKMSSALVHFEDELKKVRTGRSHPAMLESVLVEVYGQKMPLNQVANVTAPEPQLLQVTPFDPSKRRRPRGAGSCAATDRGTAQAAG
jgi:ribosome recycling factor